MKGGRRGKRFEEGALAADYLPCRAAPAAALQLYRQTQWPQGSTSSDFHCQHPSLLHCCSPHRLLRCLDRHAAKADGDLSLLLLLPPPSYCGCCENALYPQLTAVAATEGQRRYVLPAVAAAADATPSAAGS